MCGVQSLSLLQIIIIVNNWEPCTIFFIISLFIAYLRPSRELLEYYRKKIAEFDDEHDLMQQKLDHYKMTYEEQVLYAVVFIFHLNYF